MNWGKTTSLTATTALALIWTLTAAPAQDAVQEDEEVEGGIEKMTVTAQRKEESLLDVPVAVTAFDGSAIQARQIDTFSDLQFNIPNVTYTKGNFTGSNFQIRGIGSTLVAATADTGVGVHVNDVYINSPRIFETEYFDVQAVEVLRGPQGTLYGRNATGGTINMKTRRAELEEFELFIDGQYGNFDHKRITGSINIPIIKDELALRVAGIWLDRDGYTENVFNGSDIDDRSQYAIRASLRWEPTQSTRIDIIGSYFEEDSSRTRSTKQLCNRDESAILGCLPDTLEFESVNSNATLGGLVSTDLVLGPFGLVNFFNADGTINAPNDVANPRDLRKTNLDFDPIYKADETFIMIDVQQGLTENLNVSILAAYQETSVFSQQDYNNAVGDELTIPDAVFEAFPVTSAAYFSDGLFPLSDVDGTNSGVIGNRIRSRSNTADAYDQSDFEAEQYSIEVQLQSDYDGPFNFLIAGYYLDYSYRNGHYYVVASGLDYFSLLGAGVDGLALYTPFFDSDTPLYELESYAAYGEVYYEPTDTLKLTGGIRYTVDDKFVKDRQLPLISGGAVPIGTSNIQQILATTHDGDAGTPGQQAFREDDVTFREITGRFVVDWSPDLEFTDSTLIYASYSRGYKSGGFNPPIDPGLFPNTPETFDPEFLNAFEIGTKNQLLEGRLQASLTGFYYDYKGLQVGRIVNRTSLNENVDATIWGIEAEFVANPIENLLTYLSIGYINTEITDFATFDGRDPTNGDPNTTLIKDLINTSNCVVEDNGAVPFLTSDAAAAAVAAGLPLIPVGTEGFSASAFSSCGDLSAFLGAIGAPYTVTEGIPADLSGNELQNSPEWTISIGGSYTQAVGPHGHELVFRADYYWQSDFFSRIFNRPIDVVESWDNLNLSLQLDAPDKNWYIRGFVSNVFNEDNVTGHYFTDPSSGNFTNVFVLEPRLYGINVGFTY